MKNFENEYPKVYKALSSQKIASIFISLIILITFFITFKNVLEMYFENIYVKYALITIFSLVVVRSIFGIISVFSEKLIIYDRRIIFFRDFRI